MKRIAGRLLVASPYLSDGNFFRSVIYMVRHDQEGALGMLINRPSEHTLEDVFADRLGHVPRRRDVIYLGGPVQGPLMALHTLVGLGEPCGPEDANVGGPGSSPLWITPDDDHLTSLVDRTDIQARFIARYSGWGPGQLEGELDSGGWLVGPADWQTIFADHESMWENVVKKLGRDIISDIISSPPANDPQWN
jgi:putative transcriptional regulator